MWIINYCCQNVAKSIIIRLQPRINTGFCGSASSFPLNSYGHIFILMALVLAVFGGNICQFMPLVFRLADKLYSICTRIRQANFTHCSSDFMLQLYWLFIRYCLFKIPTYYKMKITKSYHFLCFSELIRWYIRISETDRFIYKDCKN